MHISCPRLCFNGPDEKSEGMISPCSSSHQMKERTYHHFKPSFGVYNETVHVSCTGKNIQAVSYLDMYALVHYTTTDSDAGGCAHNIF